MVALLDLLMPPACAACGRSGALLCPACLDGLPGALTARRSLPGARCRSGDRASRSRWRWRHSPTRGRSRRALAALKYAGASRMAPILARAAEPALRELLALTGPATLVPVPVHVERRRARGYNQAELLAPPARTADWGCRSSDPLVRARPTTKQHRLNRAARLQNLRGAFVMRAGCSRRRDARSWWTTSSPPPRRSRRAHRSCVPADARRSTGSRWRARSRPVSISISRSSSPACVPLSAAAPARSSRQSRAPRAHHTTRHGLRFGTTFVTRPGLLTKTASIAYGMKNMWIDGERSIQSPSPGLTSGVRRRPTDAIEARAGDAHPLGDGGAAGDVLDPDEPGLALIGASLQAGQRESVPVRPPDRDASSPPLKRTCLLGEAHWESMSCTLDAWRAGSHCRWLRTERPADGMPPKYLNWPLKQPGRSVAGLDRPRTRRSGRPTRCRSRPTRRGGSTGLYPLPSPGGAVVLAGRPGIVASTSRRRSG